MRGGERREVQLTPTGADNLQDPNPKSQGPNPNNQASDLGLGFGVWDFRKQLRRLFFHRIGRVFDRALARA